jgi:hypothetical protein
VIHALAYEPHFLDHLAPVWLALPASERGEFRTDPAYAPRARALGIEPTEVPAPKAIPAEPAASRSGGLTLIASYGDLKKGRRMGLGPFVYLEHGIGQSYAGDRMAASHPSYSGGRNRDDVVLNLVPNEQAAARWREAYPSTSVEVIGCPKLDALPSREPGARPVIAVSTHFNCNIAPETQSALGPYLHAIATLKSTYTFIGHGHPRAFGIDRVWKRLSIDYVADFADVCRRADVYVCDNSSTIYEFAATDRPVVVLNGPQYRRDVHHGGRFWDWASVGPQVDRPSQLAGAIAAALDDGPEVRAERERVLAEVYLVRSGAAERAVEAIAGLREAVAA